jgi:D-tyrosyl-tRNA(Tyr) deacylase
MIGLLQRVARAAVDIDGQRVGAIDRGLLVLIGVERGDTTAEAERLLARLLGYRVFPDDTGRMNRSLQEVSGGLLLVPQFTLAADTRSGTRPGFSMAAPPAEGERLFDHVVAQARRTHPRVNDGPVTFWLQVPPASAAGA